MAPVAFGGDEVPLDLLTRREGVHIVRVMRHEVLVALPTPHVYPNDGLRPRDCIAQLPLADGVRIDQCRLAVRTSTHQRAIDNHIQLARTGLHSNANRPQFADGR